MTLPPVSIQYLLIESIAGLTVGVGVDITLIAPNAPWSVAFVASVARGTRPRTVAATHAVLVLDAAVLQLKIRVALKLLAVGHAAPAPGVFRLEGHTKTISKRICLLIVAVY